MFKKDVYELTNPQKNIWELEQVNEKNPSITHILSVMKLKGNLDVNILEDTLSKIIELNDSFHIKFSKKGNNLLQHFENDISFKIEKIYLDTDDITSVIDKYKKVKITLDNLFRFAIVSTPNFTFVVYKSHHIIADAWGMTQVAEQIKDIYTKLSSGNDLEITPKTSYYSLIEREQNYLKSQKFDIDMNFWDNYVDNLSCSKLFHNSNFFDKQANRFEQVIDDVIFDKISDYCKRYKITEYAFFLGILSVYFYKIYNSNKIIFGTPFLNRQKRFKELDCTGMFISTLPLLVDVSFNDTFSDLCRAISASNLSLYKHSNFPYHKIQEMYSKKNGDNSSLYEIGFSYQINQLENQTNNQDMGECKWLFLDEQNNPITIHLSSLNHDKWIYYDYLLSCFDEDQIKRMNNIIFHLIDEVLSGKENIVSLNVLSSYDVNMLEQFNNTGNVDFADTVNRDTVISIFEKMVDLYPNNTAIICGNESISYKDLNSKINNIAKKLLSFGVSKNTPVALFFDKSIDMIASMFAVLKSGGCYVPILPDEDRARIEYILKDCTPLCVLTHKGYDEKLSTAFPIINVDEIDFSDFVNNLKVEICSEDIAYIIYTSGSTGNPKGTMVSHKNICNLRYSIEHDPLLKPSCEDVSISLLKYSFDASGIDIYTSLLFGGILLLVQKEDELNPEKVIRLMEKHHVTRSFLIPKWIEHISIQDKLLNADLSHLRILGTGGETLKPYILQNLLEKYSNLKVLNLYGPTEATMFTTCKDVRVYEMTHNYTSIGSPIFGARLAIVNKYGEFMPIGVEGELVIYEDDTSIKNIASGYLNLPEQTKKKFIKVYNPLLNKTVKAYETGDIAKINKNLEIEFVGRDDDVVKVNGGYLVALNEVESRIQSLLGNHFEVFPVAVPYRNTKAIVLFLVQKEGSISLYNIKNFINNNISFYMRPKKIIELKDFPRNSSGKINRKELQNVAIEFLEKSKNNIISPSTKTEFLLFNYIKDLIGTDDFSITDDFIDDLGIDSLSLTAIYTYLEDYNITIQDIYNNPNIKDLAYYIDNHTSTQMLPDLSNIENIKILNNVKHFDLSCVLITGVTGFLGIHLLRDLLLDENVKKIYSIIRNKINADGKSRLQKMFSYYFPNDSHLVDLAKQKIEILNGDITSFELGLDKEIYKMLQNRVTTVINSAANVKHFVKPHQIRKDNVQSVQNLIDFCGSDISLAHISTLSIAGFKGEDTQDVVFDENTLYINQKFNHNPYLISKFEAEKEILQATDVNKLNAIIFRLGNIMPRFTDGVFQQNKSQNVFMASLKAIVDTKMVAKDFLDIELEFSPVDECSKFIMALLKNNSKQSIYHILSNKEISISNLISLLKILNCDILDVKLDTFLTELNKHSDEYTREYILNNNLNKYSLDITLEFLKDLNLYWSSVDISYLQKILNIIQSFNK